MLWRSILHKTLITLCVVACTALPGCAAWPGLDDPTLTVSPEYTALRLTGETRMESGSPPAKGNYLSVADLGASDREDNLGVMLSYGEDASGFDLHYGRFEAHSSGSGVAFDAWGNIPGPSGTPSMPEQVDTRVTMDEFRARYVASFLLYEDDDEEAWLRAGAGLQLGHKEMTFDVRGINSGTAQKIEIKDDVSPMLAVRIAGKRGPIGLNIDFAYNPDLSFGTGDLHGAFYDLTILANYFLEAQELTVFAGYRRFDIPARGHEGINEFDTDFTLDGYILGFKFEF